MCMKFLSFGLGASVPSFVGLSVFQFVGLLVCLSVTIFYKYVEYSTRESHIPGASLCHCITCFTNMLFSTSNLSSPWFFAIYNQGLSWIDFGLIFKHFDKFFSLNSCLELSDFLAFSNIITSNFNYVSFNFGFSTQFSAVLEVIWSGSV